MTNIRKGRRIVLVKRVATINDLSGLGKCSLTVALPVLSVLGVQACPLPTAVLTNQTGFSSFYLDDYTEKIPHYIKQWQKRQVQFDGIYTGFLANEAQVAEILEFIRCFRTPNTLLLVDPVMGDHGKIYSTYTPALCEKMKHLVSLADAITPNLTEACILTDTDYNSLIAHQTDADYLERIAQLGKQLTADGAHIVVITGVHIFCAEDGCEYIYNVAVTGDRVSYAKSRTYGGGYSGTGDIFASVLCGYLVQGRSAQAATAKAAAFIEAALKDTYAAGIDRNEGILFEPHLRMLLEEDTP